MHFAHKNILLGQSLFEQTKQIDNL